MSESDELWNRRSDILPVAEGPLKDGYDLVMRCLNTQYLPTATLGDETLYKVSDDSVVLDSTGDLSYRRGDDPQSTEAMLYVSDREDPDLLLAIKTLGDNEPVDRYIISPDGIIVKIDDPGWSPDPDGCDTKFFQNALSSLRYKMRRTIDTREWKEAAERRRQRERRRRLTVRAVAGAAAAGVIIGGGWLVKHFLVDVPAEEAQRAQAFDAQDVKLPGDPVTLAVGKIALLDGDSFEQIPPMKEGDTLDSPRRVTLFDFGDTWTCGDTQSIKQRPGQLVFAAKEGSVKPSADIFAGLNSEGGLSVCVNPNSITEKDADLTIAVQAVKQE